MENKFSSKSSLTDEQLQKLKDEVADSLSRDRHALVCDFPFTGSLSMRMELVPVRDVRCPTACTDGNRIYFDISFYASLSKEERRFVLAHEIWHCVLLHLTRCQTRDHQLFNIATDMEVNYLLKTEGNNRTLVPPENLLFPPRELEGKCAEDIYEWLLKQQKKGKSGSSSKNDSKGGGGGESTGSGSKSKSKSGSGSGKLDGQFDKHIYDNDQEEDDQNSGNQPNGSGQPSENNSSGSSSSQQPSDQWGPIGFDKDFKPSISKDFNEKMREAVVGAAQTVQRTQGNLPAGIQAVLDKLLKPEIHWKELLSQFVTACFGDKRQWLPPNRRYVHAGSYFQSRRGEKIKIAIAVDTSGSCVQDLPKFFAELKSLVTEYGRYEIDRLDVDAEVQQHIKYSDDENPFEISNDKIEWNGGGGTSFVPAFEFLKENEIDPDCLVYLTDGYGDAPENPPPYPVLWVLTSDGNENFCSWGKKTHFKNNN